MPTTLMFYGGHELRVKEELDLVRAMLAEDGTSDLHRFAGFRDGAAVGQEVVVIRHAAIAYAAAFSS